MGEGVKQQRRGDRGEELDGSGKGMNVMRSFSKSQPGLWGITCLELQTEVYCSSLP